MEGAEQEDAPVMAAEPATLRSRLRRLGLWALVWGLSVVAWTVQFSMQANLAVMPARKKKNSVEPGRYQCHSRKEDTR